MDDGEFRRRFYPESNVSGFSNVDGTILFFNHLASIVRSTDIVLDFGAGRGAPLLDDKIEFRRTLQTFKGRCGHLDGCDVDPAVLENPFLDDAKVIEPGRSLPYEDDRFNIVFARWVFEHLDDAEFAASELLRVVKPGGIIAATTPNKWGYIAVGARIVPSRYRMRVLSRSQRSRKTEDSFPTRYKLNTDRALRNAFGHGADVFIAKKASEPAYHFGRPWIYRLIRFANKHFPDALLPVLDVYVRKH